MLTIYEEENPDFSGCVYYAYQREICPTTNREHWQCYAVWAGQIRFTTLQRRYPGAHLEPKKGSPKQASDYCTKTETRKPGTEPITFGDIPEEPHTKGGEATKRAYEEAFKLAKESKLQEIQAELLVKHYTTFKKIRRVKKEKELKEFELQKIDRNAEAQATAAERVSKAKLVEYQAKAQGEMAVEDKKSANKIIEIGVEKEAKSELMEQEFNYNIQLQKGETTIKVGLKAQDDASKLHRQNVADTHESKKIEQRTFNTPAQNFESSEDNISGGMGLEEMNPD